MKVRGPNLFDIAPTSRSKSGRFTANFGWRTSLSILKTHNYSFTDRSRRALAITETELRLMAAPAIMGLSKMPKKG